MRGSTTPRFPSFGGPSQDAVFFEESDFVGAEHDDRHRMLADVGDESLFGSFVVGAGDESIEKSDHSVSPLLSHNKTTSRAAAQLRGRHGGSALQTLTDNAERGTKRNRSERNHPMFKAHTTDDGITTEHNTVKEAKAAARQRQGAGPSGRIAFQAWQRSEIGQRGQLWEDGATDDRDLFALVFEAGDEALIVECFGVLLDD